MTLFAIAAGSLFNNVRISDLANSVNKRFDDQRDFIRPEIGSLHSENTRLEQKFDRIAETLAR